MKAVVCKKYGPPEVLQFKEMPNPVPKDNEVCIRNFATAVTGSDVLIRGADMPILVGLMFRMMIGFRKPRKPIIGLFLPGKLSQLARM